MSEHQVSGSANLLDAQEVRKEFGGLLAVNDLDFTIPERRRKREIEEGTRGSLDEPLYEMRGADEPGAGERGESGRIPRG